MPNQTLWTTRRTPGFERGRNLHKVGLHAQDTAELHFADAEVPVDNLLGQEGEGFRYLTANLAQERLSIASAGIAAARTAVDAAKAKWWATELQKRVTDRCLQLFGGYGYVAEYPIARLYADARITTIYGGTTEIMKTIIAKDLGLR
ncbi:MAG: acyl-CoA dehydrogenase family protein [Nitriliruptor sp.]